MTNLERLHKIQVHILSTLRHVKKARFSELMYSTGMTSDAFKHHTKKLISLGMIDKQVDGYYKMTASGKEYANRLNEETGRELLQPKTSTLMYVTSTIGGETYYLMHQRKREPFFNFWGIASAPLQYGVSIFDSSSQEFAKQTGLHASFQFHGVLHVIDETVDARVLEDKLFSILTAHFDDCPSFRPWHGGKFEWLSKTALQEKSPLFPTTQRVIEMVENNLRFDEVALQYAESEY